MSEAETKRLILENFDVDAFLGFEYEQATETKRILTPAGWHEMWIEDFEIVKPKLFTNKKTQAQEYSSPVLKLKCVIEDEGVRTLLGVTDPSRVLYVYPQLYLDVSIEGGIDMGPNKNILLGKLREALGQNNEGVGWRLGDLRGSKKFFAECKHDVPDAAKPDVIYERWNNFVGEMAAEAA